MSKKLIQILICSAIFLLFSLIFSIGYLSFIAPVQAEIKQLTDQLRFEEELIKALEQRESEEKKGDQNESAEILKQLPIEARLDELIVKLEELKNATSTKILNISVVEEPGYTITGFEEGTAQGQEASVTEVPQEGVTPAEGQEGQVVQPQPTLTKMELTLSVVIPDYQKLRQFINGIEKFDRTIRIQGVTIARTADGINCNLVLHAYYAPQYQGIIENIPVNKFIVPSGNNDPIKVN